MDTSSGSVERVVGLAGDGEEFIDEIAFHAGELYCTVSEGEESEGTVQLHRFDETAKRLVSVGPRIEGADGHALVIRSIPQAPEWRLVDGPSTVQILAPPLP